MRLIALFAVVCSVVRGADRVSIGVFGLFHPKLIEVAALRGSPVIVRADNHETRLDWPRRTRVIAAASIVGENGGDCDFVLSVPGRITRHYRGTGAIQADAGELVAVVTMDVETAVASIVAAESPPGAPPAALEAQAVVARSFLRASGPRHKHAMFCDTTHCQFLRDPPPPDSLFAKAAASTRGLVLVYEGRPMVALYSANCGGRTRTLKDARLATDGYPYFRVDCPAQGLPSGHRIGLCQEGAAAMARKGVGWREIVNHYFPGTGISSR